MIVRSSLTDDMQTVQKLGRLGPVGKVSCLAGGCDSLLPAKYDTHDRLIAQVTSTITLYMFQFQGATWYS